MKELEGIIDLGVHLVTECAIDVTHSVSGIQRLKTNKQREIDTAQLNVVIQILDSIFGWPDRPTTPTRIRDILSGMAVERGWLEKDYGKPYRYIPGKGYHNALYIP